MLWEWANEIRTAVGLAPQEADRGAERRREARSDFCGHKLIVRQRRALGILHLRNLSANGGCGITDMPLEVGSIVFLELRKSHFHTAEVCWTRSLSIGLKFFRPIRSDVLKRLHLARKSAKPIEKRAKGRPRLRS